uniref:Uncharacterized protein n=1 Tax=Glossina pallidipes TaxID=7398 RepID=A0A1B0AJF2_GLOPL
MVCPVPKNGGALDAAILLQIKTYANMLFYTSTSTGYHKNVLSSLKKKKQEVDPNYSESCIHYLGTNSLSSASSSSSSSSSSLYDIKIMCINNALITINKTKIRNAINYVNSNETAIKSRG